MTTYADKFLKNRGGGDQPKGDPARRPANPPKGSGMPRQPITYGQDAPGSTSGRPRCLTEAEYRIRMLERAVVALMPLMKQETTADQVAAIVSLAMDGARA